MKRLLSTLVLGLWAATAGAQDQLPFSRVVLVNNPLIITSWPITASITKVHFELAGWRVDFDKRLGPGAWPNIQSPSTGGTDTLQYTLGLCRKVSGWTCSATVQFWQTRLEEEGVAAGALPSEIGKNWFYDSRWGELAGWQPALGEEVGVFIAACDDRNTAVVFPGCMGQRTNAIIVKWGVDWAPTTVPPIDVPPTHPPTDTPTDPPQPPHVPTDTAALQAQIERIYADLVKRDEARANQIEAARADLSAHIDNPGWFKKVMGSRYVQMAIAAVGTYVTTHQMSKP